MSTNPDNSTYHSLMTQVTKRFSHGRGLVMMKHNAPAGARQVVGLNTPGKRASEGGLLELAAAFRDMVRRGFHLKF